MEDAERRIRLAPVGVGSVQDMSSQLQLRAAVHTIYSASPAIVAVQPWRRPLLETWHTRMQFVYKKGARERALDAHHELT